MPIYRCGLKPDEFRCASVNRTSDPGPTRINSGPGVRSSSVNMTYMVQLQRKPFYCIYVIVVGALDTVSNVSAEEGVFGLIAGDELTGVAWSKIVQAFEGDENSFVFLSVDKQGAKSKFHQFSCPLSSAHGLHA